MGAAETTPRAWAWVLLFTTSGTLLCCALPIALVALGLGGVVASLAGAAPWLVTLSQYKGWMFLASGALIALAALALYRPGRACPADPRLAAACARAEGWNRRFLWLAAGMWSLGLGAAYLPVWLS